MTITCFIVDDEYHSIEVLKEYIEQTPDLQLIGSTTNPLEAIPLLTGANPPMITFLDVDMPELSGIDVAAIVNQYTRVIFTTGHRSYAYQAFEQDANDYLLKPVTYPRFLKSVVKVKKLINDAQVNDQQNAGSSFYIKTEVKGKMQKVVTSDIAYVEGAQNYITLHMQNGTKTMAYLTMNEVAEHLPSKQFARVHKSFIVNKNAIKILEHGQVTLDNHAVVPIGRAYKDDFIAEMKTLLITSKRSD